MEKYVSKVNANPQILHSEKVTKRSVYKNKFQLFHEQQAKEHFLQREFNLLHSAHQKYATISNNQGGGATSVGSGATKPTYRGIYHAPVTHRVRSQVKDGYGSLDEHKIKPSSLASSLDADDITAVANQIRAHNEALVKKLAQPQKDSTVLTMTSGEEENRQPMFNYMSEAITSNFQRDQQKPMDFQFKQMPSTTRGGQKLQAFKNFKEDMYYHNQLKQKPTVTSLESNLMNTSIDNITNKASHRLGRTNQNSSSNRPYLFGQSTPFTPVENQFDLINQVSRDSQPDRLLQTQGNPISTISPSPDIMGAPIQIQDLRARQDTAPGSQWNPRKKKPGNIAPLQSLPHSRQANNKGSMIERREPKLKAENKGLVSQSLNLKHHLRKHHHVHQWPLSRGGEFDTSHHKSVNSKNHPELQSRSTQLQSEVDRPKPTWKENMMKASVQQSLPKPQYLPQIGKGPEQQKPKVKPNYYRNKRTLNYTKVYDEVTGSQRESESLVLPSQDLLSHEGFRKKPLIEERRAESMYVPKRHPIRKSIKQAPMAPIAPVAGGGPLNRSNIQTQQSPKPRTTATKREKVSHEPRESREPEHKRRASIKNSLDSHKSNKRQSLLEQRTSLLKSPNRSKRASFAMRTLTKEIQPAQDLITTESQKMRSTASGHRSFNQGRASVNSSKRRKGPIGVNFSQRYEKVPVDPGLFKIFVNREHLLHLMNDDLDDVSKNEVVYKILKDQLRSQQKKLITLKQEKKKARELRRQSTRGKVSPSHSPSTQRTLQEFAKRIKPFELYGPQRDLSPSMKRLLKNLECQEHKYMYCPTCKEYDETDYDPIDNINKFLKYIKQEQDKLNPPISEKKLSQAQRRAMRDLPDDSVSEITDLDQEDVLNKYYREKASQAEQRKRERDKARRRIEGGSYVLKHICTTNHRKQKEKGLTYEQMEKPPPGDFVEMQIRQNSERAIMQDEEHSAHQFSLKDQSIQADSEERLELEMQASNRDLSQSPNKAVLLKSPGDRSHHSVVKIGYSAAKLDEKDQLFKTSKNKDEIGVQTYDMSPSPIRSPSKSPKKTVKMEADLLETKDFDVSADNYSQSQFARGTELDYCLDDWEDSLVYKRAMKAEAIKRGKTYSEYDVDEEEFQLTQADLLSINEGSPPKMTTPFKLEGSPEITLEPVDPAENNIGFMKKAPRKGNIKMLSESEISYLKAILKQDTENWESKSTLEDLYRHCKFTIRKLTKQMANIDNRKIFKKNKVPSRENTLFMVYRAERLYSALGDVERICKHMSKHMFDTETFDEIKGKTGQKVIRRDEESFVKKREQLIKRLQGQISNFLGQYSIFSDNFQFKSVHINEFLQLELDKCLECLKLIDQFKRLQNNEFCVMSGHVNEKENQKQIITIPKEPGPTSPYYSRVQIPEESLSNKIKSSGSSNPKPDATQTILLDGAPLPKSILSGQASLQSSLQNGTSRYDQVVAAETSRTGGQDENLTATLQVMDQSIINREQASHFSGVNSKTTKVSQALQVVEQSSQFQPEDQTVSKQSRAVITDKRMPVTRNSNTMLKPLPISELKPAKEGGTRTSRE